MYEYQDQFFAGYQGDFIVSTNFRFQDASSSDKSALSKLDAKCYDYPLDDNEWQQILSSAPPNNALPADMHRYVCVTYRMNNTIIGYYVYDDKPQETEFLNLLRLGVHPDHRTKGIGTLLVDNAKQKASSMGFLEAQIVIPEYCLDPAEGRGIVNFIDTTGMVPQDYLRDHYFHYGKLYDGILYRTGGRRKLEFASV